MRAQATGITLRVRLLRLVVLVLVGSGLAFAAVQLAPPAATLRQAGTDAGAPPEPASVDAGDAGDADDAGDVASGDAAEDGAAPAGDGSDDIAPVRELTAEEIEAELEAAEAAMGGAAPADARNRAAERPLPADLPVALPSDI